MKQIFKIIATVIFMMSQILSSEQPSFDPKIDISGQWFLTYNYNNSLELSQFALKRGYFTVKTKMNDYLSARYTQDITLDKEGSDAGNVEIRLKYLYLKIKLDQFRLFQNSYVEMGLVHRPWLEFEQAINPYRVQGKMFLERYKIIGSADFGVFVSGLLGGKIDDTYQKTVTKNHPGKFGSYSFAVHNGGGYYAIEQNNNKTFEGRLTARPFFKLAPGLQLTYAFVYGNVNTENANDFLMNTLFASYQTAIGNFTAQYYTGSGDFFGKYTDENGDSFNNEGYSIFGELNILNSNFSLIGRFDNFTSHQDTDILQSTIITGISYKFLKNKVLLDVDYQKNPDETIKIYELVLEIGF